MTKIIMGCDGGCHNNQCREKSIGGWGTVLQFGEYIKELYGGEKPTTNNRMEIMAVIQGLEALKTTEYEVELYTDSKYVCDCLTKKWYVKWRTNGWNTTAKKPVENRDLWERVLPLYEKYNPQVFWVKGHAGHPLNEQADTLTQKAIAEIEELEKV